MHALRLAPAFLVVVAATSALADDDYYRQQMYQQQQQELYRRQQQQQDLYRQQQQQALYNQQLQQQQFQQQQLAAQQERQRLDAQRYEQQRLDQQREREGVRRQQERREDERREENAAIQQRERDAAFERQKELRQRQFEASRLLATGQPLPVAPAAPAAQPSGPVQSATWSGVPKDFATLLRSLIQRGARIEGVAFTPKGGWLIIFDGNDFHSSGIPAEMIDALRRGAAVGARLRSPAFGDDGAWAFIVDSNGSGQFGLPPNIRKGLLLANEHNERIGSVSVAGAAGIVIRGRNGWSSTGLPEDLVKALEAAHGAAQSIEFATLGPEGWWVMSKEGGSQWMWSAGLPTSLATLLGTKTNDRLSMLAVAPGGGWVVVMEELKAEP